MVATSPARINDTPQTTMPDWSYATVTGPLLRLCPHDASRRFVNGVLGAMSRVPQGYRMVDILGHMAPGEEIATDLPTGQRIASSGVMMPCINPEGTAANAFSRFGVGALTFGPVAPSIEAGPTFTQGEDDSVIGSGGAAVSLDEACAMVDRTGSAAYFFEIDPFADDKPLACLADLVDGLASAATAIIVSPQNYEQLMGLDESDRNQLLTRFSERCAGHHVTPFVGVPLSVSAEQVQEHARAFHDLGLGLYLSGAAHEDDASWKWGGPDQVDAARTLTAVVKKSSEVFVLVDGGVRSPRDANELRLAGADLIGIGPGFVRTGPGLAKRINETFAYFKHRENNTGASEIKDDEVAERRPWIWGALMGLAMLVGALIAGWSALTHVLLPYDEAFLGRTAQDLSAFNHRILMFMTHDRITLAGTMVSLGILYMSLSWFEMRRGRRWAQRVVTVSGTLGFLTFFTFLAYGYLDPFHAFVAALLLQVLIQVTVRKIGPRLPARVCPRLDNDHVWRASLWGQLSFIAHGAALVLAGGTILTFGMTVVFVPQDISYLGTDVAAIEAFDAPAQGVDRTRSCHLWRHVGERWSCADVDQHVVVSPR